MNRKRMIMHLAAMNNTNKNLDMLAQKYGHLEVQYFVGGTWRLSFSDFHQHHSIASHGDLFADGNTIEEAIMRLHEMAKKHPPREGQHCRQGCPEYSPDIY